VKVRFLTFAQQEIDEAYVWFEERSAGKGVEFLNELDRAVRLVRAYPLASTEIEPGVRRCIFAHFPYALLYGIDGDTVVVVAVSHSHRRPDYWIYRERT
jgi:plasmid stabilization system protein ParE